MGEETHDTTCLVDILVKQRGLRDIIWSSIELSSDAEVLLQ